MIKSKDQMREYIQLDRLALGGVSFKHRLKAIFVPCIWKFETKMRRCEYYKNCRKDFLGIIIFQILYLSYQRYGRKLGYDIGINVFGPGLCLCHPGTIIISYKSKFGKNARIHAGVNIGNYSRDVNDDFKSPIFGDNIYIGPGAKVFGSIHIGDDVAIGANSVVNSDIPNHVTVAGIPARIINEKGSEGLIR